MPPLVMALLLHNSQEMLVEQAVKHLLALMSYLMGETAETVVVFLISTRPLAVLAVLYLLHYRLVSPAVLEGLKA